MKAVILAGGRGTRMGDDSGVEPKPMVRIGDRPILWHIMKIYAAHGVTDFVVACGYRGDSIKRYFANYVSTMPDFTVELKTNQLTVHRGDIEDWRITLVDTGDSTMTGGRLARVAGYLDPASNFCLTYGDGVADIDITESIKFHESHGKLATISAVSPPGRFGALRTTGTRVDAFAEKPDSAGLINGGFFVLSPKVLDYLHGDGTVWEHEPLDRLALDDELRAYRHSGFWQPMDTARERDLLDELWRNGKAPWKIWQ